MTIEERNEEIVRLALSDRIMELDQLENFTELQPLSLEKLTLLYILPKYYQVGEELMAEEKKVVVEGHEAVLTSGISCTGITVYRATVVVDGVATSATGYSEEDTLKILALTLSSSSSD